MVDIQGYQLSDLEREILSHDWVVAVILFTRNFKSREQLIALTTSIREIKPSLIIAVDQEGGYVQRFQRNGFRPLPALRVLGHLYDINPTAACQLATSYARIMAKDLLDCGVTLSLGPVVDLHGNNQVIGGLDRAFHADPSIVSLLANAYIEGMKAEGMSSVIKHFPGHGSCDADSHVAKPIHTGNLSELMECDLKPFIDLIKQDKADFVMTAHVVYPDIDPQNVASFSKRWLLDILRQELGFKGIILSDCIGMAAADIGDLLSRATHAFSAGCTIVIVANQPREELIKLLDELSSEAHPVNHSSTQADLNRTVAVWD